MDSRGDEWRRTSVQGGRARRRDLRHANFGRKSEQGAKSATIEKKRKPSHEEEQKGPLKRPMHAACSHINTRKLTETIGSIRVNGL